MPAENGSAHRIERVEITPNHRLEDRNHFREPRHAIQDEPAFDPPAERTQLGKSHTRQRCIHGRKAIAARWLVSAWRSGLEHIARSQRQRALLDLV
jgi:hypothetical protein